MQPPEEAELQAAIGQMTACWLIGGEAAAAAPAGWRSAEAADAQERELRLLALAGQFRALTFDPSPPQAPHPYAPLPALPLALLPAPLRPAFRRMARVRYEREALLAFLASRGYAAHPADWLPQPGETLPDVYAPWQDWANNEGRRADGAALPLAAETWERMGRATRRAKLRVLWQRDRAAARELLAGNLASLPADDRLALLQALPPPFEEADVPLLEQLAIDPSAKVGAWVTATLARLARNAADAAPSRELASLLRYRRKGLLRPARVEAPSEDGPSERASELSDIASFDAVAAALGLTPDEFVIAWRFRAEDVSAHWLRDLAAATTSTPVARRLALRLCEAESGLDWLSASLLSRLGPEARHLAKPWFQQRDRRIYSFATSGGIGLELAMADFKDSAALAFFFELAETTKLPEPTREEMRRTHSFREEACGLGLLLSCEAAAELLDALAARGFARELPSLEMLRMNTALPPRSEAP